LSIGIYDLVKPVPYEENPVAQEIVKLLKSYKGLEKKLDSEAAKLKSAKNTDQLLDRLEKLQKRADKDFKEIRKMADRWTQVASPKSYLAGQDLADKYIEKQSKIKAVGGDEIKILDLIPRDKAVIKKTLDKVRDESLRQVKLINDSWKDNFDSVVRQGMKESQGVRLIKDPGSRGGTTTGREIGSRLYQQIKDEGLKIVDKAGRKWTPERYIRMYARTRTREIQTQGLESRMDDYGLDLVKISEHVDIDGMDICNELEGRIFSLSGDHPDYPKLPRKTPFHPNCAHVETPWVEKYRKKRKELNKKTQRDTIDLQERYNFRRHKDRTMKYKSSIGKVEINNNLRTMTDKKQPISDELMLKSMAQLDKQDIDIDTQINFLDYQLKSKSGGQINAFINTRDVNKNIIVGSRTTENINKSIENYKLFTKEVDYHVDKVKDLKPEHIISKTIKHEYGHVRTLRTTNYLKDDIDVIKDEFKDYLDVLEDQTSFKLKDTATSRYKLGEIIAEDYRIAITPDKVPDKYMLNSKVYHDDLDLSEDKVTNRQEVIKEILGVD